MWSYIAEASETSVVFEPFADRSAGQATGEEQATGIEARGGMQNSDGTKIAPQQSAIIRV